MNTKYLVALALLLLASPTPAGQLHFERSTYTVSPGDSFEVRVYLDMDENTPGDQLPASGLFSVGAQITYDPANATSTVNDIVLPAAVDGNGIGGPAFKDAGAGYVGAAGVVDFDATEGYMDSLVMTVTITDLATGTYPLDVEFYFVPPTANFVEYDPPTRVLDEEITNFVSTTVQALPNMTIMTMGMPAAGQVRFEFEDSGTGAGSYSVETAEVLADPTVWAAAPGATVTPLGGDLYQVDAVFTGPTQQFYQVKGNL